MIARVRAQVLVDRLRARLKNRVRALVMARLGAIEERDGFDRFPFRAGRADLLPSVASRSRGDAADLNEK